MFISPANAGDKFVTVVSPTLGPTITFFFSSTTLALEGGASKVLVLVPVAEVAFETLESSVLVTETVESDDNKVDEGARVAVMAGVVGMTRAGTTVDELVESVHVRSEVVTNGEQLTTLPLLTDSSTVAVCVLIPSSSTLLSRAGLMTAGG
jgi:hypothetical protein